MTSLFRTASLYSLTHALHDSAKMRHVSSDINLNESAVSDQNRQIFKSIKGILKKKEKHNIQEIKNDNIFEDWKTVARRIDRITFVLSLFVVFGVPIYLFGRYAINRNRILPKNGCGCDL